MFYCHLLTINNRCIAFGIFRVQFYKLSSKSTMKFDSFKSLNMCVQPDTNSDCESIQGSYLSHIITQHGLPIMNYHLASVDLNYPSLKCIHSNPPVFEINNFLSPQQCSNLINNAQSSQSLGGLGLSQTMSGSKIASTRTSSTCYLPHETVSVSEVVNLAKLLTGDNDKNSNDDAYNKILMMTMIEMRNAVVPLTHHEMYRYKVA